MKITCAAWTLILTFYATPMLFGQTQTIDFEQFSGPSGFSEIQPPLTIGVATFSGGQILTNTTNLPADESTLYGTASFCSGCLSTITIDFAQPVSNFSAFLANGQVFTVIYTVQDDQGGSQTITLVANFQSGAGTVTLPSTGIRQVTITSNAAEWDFFIDNVSFVPCSTTVTAVTVTTNKNCDSRISRNCSANIVVGDSLETTEITTTVQPAQSVSVDLSVTFGTIANVQTNTSGVGRSLYTSGTMLPGSTNTTIATFSARICQSAFPNLGQVFDYRGFDFHQLAVTDSEFTDSTAMDATAIQGFFVAHNSFLSKFVLVGRIGGFLDLNGNGALDPGEPVYSASGKTIPLHVHGVSAANVIVNFATGQGINPKILLVTLEKENSLIGDQTLPSATVLNFAMGCGPPSNFVAQINCAAITLVNRFNDATAFGRIVSYPFFFRATDGIRQAVTARCDVQPFLSGCKRVAFAVEDAATYAQYRYTPFVQALLNGGGVYRFERLWQTFEF